MLQHAAVTKFRNTGAKKVSIGGDAMGGDAQSYMGSDVIVMPTSDSASVEEAKPADREEGNRV